MTVLKNERNAQSDLQVIVKARELAKYSVDTLKQEKYFPKRDRWILANPIAKQAIEIVTLLRKANSINCKIADGYIKRREFQLQAYGACEALLTLLQIAYDKANLDSHKVEVWTGMVLNVENLLQPWTYSDWERYSNMFPELLEKTCKSKETIGVVDSLNKAIEGLKEVTQNLQGLSSKG